MLKRILLPLALLLVATAAMAQTPIEIEAGYRFSDVNGNEDLYRSQINEREGFVIRSLLFFTSAPAPGVDHFRLDATELGTSPASSVRIDTGKNEAYRLRLGYRTFDSFRSLPAFANPFLAQGITTSQHTFDRNRTMFDADLEFLPGRKFSPFVGYSWGRNEGPGTTTYALGGDEFRLSQDLDETEREFRVGTGFTLGKFYGSVTQGWRSLKSDEKLAIIGGAEGGNNPGTILGTPITGSPARDSRVDVDTPFTNLFVAADATQRIKIIGNYSRFSADSDGFESETATGSFVSFALGRSYKGIEEDVTSRAKNKTWRGGLRGEIAISDRFGFLVGYRRDHRELEGSALIDTLYRDTLTFAGFDRRDVSEIVEARSVLERDVDTYEAAFTGRGIGPFSFRLGVSESNHDLTVAPDLSEIVVPGNQGGTFERGVRTYDASATYAKGLFTAGAALRRDDADDPVLRTDFVDRNRIRLRAGFHTPGNMFRAGITGEKTDQSNDREDIGFDADAKQYMADAEFAPIPMLRFRGSYAKLDVDSTVHIRRPETFVIETSRQREDGEAIEGGVALLVKQLSLDASLSRYDNEGSIPFSFDRYRMRAVYDFLANMGVAAEWSRDNYEEDFAYGQYDADRYGIFLRFRR